MWYLKKTPPKNDYYYVYDTTFKTSWQCHSSFLYDFSNNKKKDTKIAIICHCAVQHNSDEIFLVAQIILGKAGFMQ